MTEYQQRKQIIRSFMRSNYSDERLAMLLAHAQEGKLVFDSCCCFVGISTAQHALLSGWGGFGPHGDSYIRVIGGIEASNTYASLGREARPEKSSVAEKDAIRRRVLIPMIRAEMKRREHAKQVVRLSTRNEHVGGGVPIVSCSGGES